MALLSKNRIAWEYDSDDGTTYRVAAMSAVTVQDKQGGRAWAGTAPPLPFGYKMRRMTVRSATLGTSRVVPIYSTDAALMTPGETVMLNGLSDSSIFTGDGGPTLIPETRPRHSVTKQST